MEIDRVTKRAPRRVVRTTDLGDAEEACSNLVTQVDWAGKAISRERRRTREARKEARMYRFGMWLLFFVALITGAL